MTSDDQQFLDLLASVPQDLAHYGGRLADYIEKHTSSFASDIRDAIDSATWLPESLKPHRHSGHGSHRFFSQAPPPPQGYYEKTVAFVSRNRTTIAVICAFAGTTFYLIHRRKREHARKRRAKKLPNGAKRELIVLACSTFHDPLTRSLALDLERRGYVVYVTVSSTEEDSLVQQEAKADLRPLWIDLTSTVPNPSTDTHPNLEPIRELLTKSASPPSPSSSRMVSGASMQNMTLAGVIVFPGSTGYPTGTLTALHPSDVVDSINTRLLSPILTIQQFLPLLQRHSTDPKQPSNIILAYPSIPQSLTPPTQIPETIITTSLSALASSLRREVTASNSNIVITELKLGNFDLGSTPSTKSSLYNGSSLYSDPTSSALTIRDGKSSLPSPSQETQQQQHWHSSQRAAATRSTFGQTSLIRGSSARELHNAVFDALAPPPQTFNPLAHFSWSSTSKSHSVVFVGSGARVYDLVGKILPGGLVGWMMGFRYSTTQQSQHSSSSSSSSHQHQTSQRQHQTRNTEKNSDEIRAGTSMGLGSSFWASSTSNSSGGSNHSSIHHSGGSTSNSSSIYLGGGSGSGVEESGIWEKL